jgi:hypothetical protein
MTKLIVAYRNFAKAPKNISSGVKCVILAWMWSFIELSTFNYFGDAVVEGVNERDKFDQILKNKRSIHQELIDRGTSDFMAVGFSTCPTVTRK